MAEVVCAAKHTVPQIPDNEWKCPKCGVGVEYKDPDTGRVEQGLVIQDPVEGSEEYCSMLHDGDEVGCDHCGWGASGKKFAALYAKQKDLVLCPCCKGKGMVPSKVAAKGFTLIELMIVVAILGIIASIAVPQVNKILNPTCRSISFTLDGKPVVWLLGPRDQVVHFDNNRIEIKKDGKRTEISGSWTLADRECPAEVDP